MGTNNFNGNSKLLSYLNLLDRSSCFFKWAQGMTPSVKFFLHRIWDVSFTLLLLASNYIWKVLVYYVIAASFFIENQVVFPDM